MKKITTALLLTAAALPALAENKFSAELLLGMSDQKSKTAGSNSISGDDVSFGFRGAYLATETIAVELAYQEYGDIDNSYPALVDGGTITDNISSKAYTLGMKGLLPFDNGFSLHARAGISFWDYRLDIDNSNFPKNRTTLKDDGTGLYYGIGMQYALNDHIDIGLEYTVTEMRVRLDTGTAVEHDVKNLGLALTYSY